jgi:6-phosphogluconolactonase
MSRATVPTTAQWLQKSFRRVLSILAIAPLLIFAACSSGGDSGGGAPPSNNPNAVGAANQFAYVVNYDANNVQAFTTDGNGNFTAVGGLMTTGTNPHNVSIDKANRFVYISNHGSSFVSGYKINPDGSLAPMNAVAGSPVTDAADPSNNSPHWSVSDQNSQFLYVIAGVPPALSTLKSYSIDQNTGALTQIGTTGQLAQCSHGHNVAISPDNRFLYVACEDSGTVYSFSRNTQTGALTNLGPTTVVAGGSTPSAVVLQSSAGKLFLYATSTNSVAVFNIDANAGTLSPILGGNNTFQARPEPHNITLDPTGQFLYTANIFNASISAFSIDQNTGALTELAGSPFATDGGPNEVLVHPDGKVLFTADQDTSGVARFTVSANGTLTRNGDAATFAGGSATNGIAMTKK